MGCWASRFCRNRQCQPRHDRARSHASRVGHFLCRRSAHADFKVNDKFNIIAGIRYSIDTRPAASHAYQRGIPNDVFTVLGVFPAPAYDASHT
jgi:hypothetical protein